MSFYISFVNYILYCLNMFFILGILKWILIYMILLLRVRDPREKKWWFGVLNHPKLSGIKQWSVFLMILRHFFCSPWPPHTLFGGVGGGRQAEMSRPLFPWGLSSSSTSGRNRFHQNAPARLLGAHFGTCTSLIPRSTDQSKWEANPESGAGKWTQTAKYVLILLLEFLKFQGLHFSVIKGNNFFKEQTVGIMLFS